jgi:hypothetical protein
MSNHDPDEKLSLDDNISKLEELIATAGWLINAINLYHEPTNLFSNSEENVRTKELLTHYIKQKIIPENEKTRKQLKKDLEHIQNKIQQLITIVKEKKLEDLSTAKQDELTSSLAKTIDTLTGKITFKEYNLESNNAQGAPWPKLGWHLITIGIGLWFAGVAVAYILSGHVMVAALLSCFLMGTISLGLSLVCFNRTGVSSSMYELGAKLKKSSSTEDVIQNLFEKAIPISEINKDPSNASALVFEYKN